MGRTRWDGPGMGGRKDIMSCLALGTRQETQSDSFVKGHTMPGHPPSPVGKRQPAASFPGESHSSSKAEVGAHPSGTSKRYPEHVPRLCTKVQQCPGPSTGDSHCQGPPSSSEGLAGPRDKRKGGRARTWLRRSPSLPWLCFAAVPGPGRRPRLTFLCLPGLPGPIKPKYSHSPGGHM